MADVLSVGDMTGPGPVDRGQPGAKLHALSDRAGIPLAVGISAVSFAACAVPGGQD